MKNNLTILIVEDEQLNIEIISNCIDKKYNLKIARDGDKGYEAFIKFKPDIIIADINMPKLNGIDMIKKIRDVDKNTQIIVLTSHKEINYLIDAVELNLVKYLIKPIKNKELLDSIKKAIDNINQINNSNQNLIYLKNNLIWSFDNMSLTKDNQDIKLNPKEKKLLYCLFKDINIVKTYDYILETVWDSFYEKPSKDSLKALINKLRKKLPYDIIDNIYKIGYKINNSY